MIKLNQLENNRILQLKMIEYDNIIDSKLADQIELALMSGFIKWQYAASTISKSFIPPYNYTPLLLDSHQLVSSIVAEGKVLDEDVFKIIQPIFDNLLKLENVQEVFIERIKINTLFRDQELKKDMFNVPHTDNIDPAFKTFLYYVNNSDGDTYFFNNFSTDQSPFDLLLSKSFSPKKGKGILFPSNQFHASSNPNSYLRRLVINFVYKVIA
jgi:hypothetical protein